MCVEIVPGVPYFGTGRGRDKSLECLMEKMSYHLKHFAITPELEIKAEQVVHEWLTQEICEGRIKDGALKILLHFRKEDSHLDVRFLPAEPNEQFFEEIVGRKPVNDDLHRAWCEEGGKPGHLYCGWCAECHQPRFICGHLAETPLPGPDPSDDEPWG